MLFEGVGSPLRAIEREVPRAGAGQLLLRVRACAVCRTDLHLMDGEVNVPSPPRILGHQIVGTVGSGTDRVGVPWLGWTCGVCAYCTSRARESVPARALHGPRHRRRHGRVHRRRRALLLPAPRRPLRCRGGAAALRGPDRISRLTMCGDARRVGIYGFGAAAHIITQVARWQGREVYAFTRAADDAAQGLARDLGATLGRHVGRAASRRARRRDHLRAGGPAGAARADRARARAAPSCCGGIHMSDIPSIPYELLWHERSLRSVANLTRRDGEEFLRARPARRDTDPCDHLPAGARRRRPRRPARRPVHRCGGADSAR